MKTQIQDSAEPFAYSGRIAANPKNASQNKKSRPGIAENNPLLAHNRFRLFFTTCAVKSGFMGYLAKS